MHIYCFTVCQLISPKSFILCEGLMNVFHSEMHNYEINTTGCAQYGCHDYRCALNFFVL